MPTRQGSIRLFQLFGINVYLHFTWFLVIYYFIYQGKGYSSPLWSVLICLSLFLIVLMHEFGHSLACRQVGGQANQIVLWPLGGVAYVAPPQRAGAMLWSIAAGPLVNVVLFPVFSIIWWVGYSANWMEIFPNVYLYIMTLWYINVLLLAFNLLPIYPLDGGQILQSLLWFVFGRSRSLMIATIIGFIGIAAFIPVLIMVNQMWYYLLAGFALLNCWDGLMQACALARVAKMPRRDGFACPSCHATPPLGELWRCGKCGKAFDAFLTQAACPHCGTQFNATLCVDCGMSSPIHDWAVAPSTGNMP